ncbi:MAG: hypothetical protein LRS49_05490 [Desulfurococcales archaeon]|nr:hypothetical protein [Desulfurococcales archaeon]
MEPGDGRCPRAATAAVLVALFTLSWAAASIAALEPLRPGHQVYVLRVSGFRLAGAFCTLAGPVYVGSPPGSGNGSLVLLPYRGLVVPGFRVSASCASGRLVVLAGSYHGRPALALVDPLAASARLVTPSDPALWGRFSTVACSAGRIAAAGLANGRVLVAAGPTGEAFGGSGWVAGTLDVPGRPRFSLASGNTSYVLLYDGSVIAFNGSGAALLEPRAAGEAKLYPRGLTLGPGGPWLYGRARLSNSSWGFIAPLAGGEGYLVRSKTHGGAVLAASWVGGRWLLYYRPGSYWDSILESTPAGGFDGVRLLWKGEHSVETIAPAQGGFDTGTVVLSGWRVVIACFRGLREASYWLGGEPVAHVTLIPHPESIETSRLRLASPRVEHAGLSRVEVELRPLELRPYEGEWQWLGEAEAKWWGPLYAASFAGLGIVFFALALRGFGCARW